MATFKSVFEQRHIGKAAEAQGLTQSAVSKHLRKLRLWFDDELFVRTTQGMQPTAKAMSIIERVETILSEIDALSTASYFDIATLETNFVIATTDEVRRQLLPKLLAQVQEAAPRLRLTLIPLEPDYSIHKLEMGAVNLVISVIWRAPDQLQQQHLFCDHFVCLMSERHPLAQKSLTIDEYVNVPHLMVAPLGMKYGYMDDQLLQRGRKRFVKLS